MNISLNVNELVKMYVKQPPILVKDQIKLRPLSPLEDAKAFFQLNKELSSEQWISNRPIWSVDEAAAYLLGCRDNPRIMVWAIVTEQGKWIGITWLMPESDNGMTGDLRIRLFPKYQSESFTSVLNILLAFSFNDLNMHKIFFRERKQNLWMKELLKRCGFSEIEEEENTRINNEIDVYWIDRKLRLIKR